MCGIQKATKHSKGMHIIKRSGAIPSDMVWGVSSGEGWMRQPNIAKGCGCLKGHAIGYGLGNEQGEESVEGEGGGAGKEEGPVPPPPPRPPTNRHTLSAHTPPSDPPPPPLKEKPSHTTHCHIGLVYCIMWDSMSCSTPEVFDTMKRHNTKIQHTPIILPALTRTVTCDPCYT